MYNSQTFFLPSKAQKEIILNVLSHSYLKKPISGNSLSAKSGQVVFVMDSTPFLYFPIT